MSPSAGADAGAERPRRKRPGDREEAEGQAHEATDVVRLGEAAAGALSDGPVPEAVRAPVEAWTGTDLSHVRIDTTTDPTSIAGDAGLVAAAEPTTVYTGLAGPLRGTRLAEQVLVHELVHTAQLAETPARASEQPGTGHRLQPLRLGFCGGSSGTSGSSVKSADPFDKLRSGGVLSQADAKSLLDAYEKLAGADRDKIVTEFHKVGSADDGVRHLLDALDPKELERRRDLVADLQERVQDAAVQLTAGKTYAQLGVIEGATMKAQAEAQALADAKAEAAKKGLPPPLTVSPGAVAKAQDAETKKTSPVGKTVVNAWNAIPKQHAKWDARAAAVISKVVAACAKVAPELHITAANLKWAPKEVAQAGANVYAFSGDPISFGMNFVETAEANPDYCVRTVVHEIAGHPDFVDGNKSPEAIIYERAHKAEPSLGSPWDTEEEQNTFGYIGTEIYAALREVPYDVPLTAKDNAKGLGAITIADNIDNKVGLVKSKFTAATGVAIVQGLYERFRVDPRVQPKALALFVTIVEKNFGKVLKK